MEKHQQLTDSVFSKKFQDGTLPSRVFTHQAHLRLAWIHINAVGIDQAILNITRQLKNYTNLLGATDKYHETVTISAIRAVYHFMLKSNTTNFNGFISENPRLETNFKELLGSHYSFNLFTSIVAKSEYVEPDLLPFN